MILKDRIALVTGAAGGIGQAICTALAAEGATIGVITISKRWRRLI
jgi:NAD(P)-dependent dehydrogenase (short-subunit alcohol dehydrogenase family)